MEEGRLVGNFLLGPRIGQGGQASVYRARHRFLERDAAIKILHPHLSATLSERFFREASTTSSLDHPGIVRILDCGLHEGAAYIAMELLSGRTLREVNVSHLKVRYSITEVTSIMIGVTSALALAHERGIVHRDLKPSNIFLLPDGSTKLLDFGVAKVSDSSLTEVGEFVGNQAYAPYEQWSNSADASPASDVYSLGAIMFEMMTGKLPPRRNPRRETSREDAAGLPLSVSLIQRGTPGPAAELIVSCLDDDPETRPQNADELCRRLQAVSVGSQVARRGTPQFQGYLLSSELVAPSQTETQYERSPAEVPRNPSGEHDPAPKRWAAWGALVLGAIVMAAFLSVSGHRVDTRAARPMEQRPGGIVASVSPEVRPAVVPRPALPPPALAPAALPPPARPRPAGKLELMTSGRFPAELRDALNAGLANGKVLRHGVLDLPMDGEWFLYWSDKTFSQSHHVPQSFVAHLTNEEDKSIVVRPEFAMDGSWAILVESGRAFKSDSFPEDLFPALSGAAEGAHLALFEMLPEDPEADPAGAPAVALYSDDRIVVSNDDGRKIKSGVDRVTADGGRIVDVMADPGGGWLMIGTRTVAMSSDLDRNVRKALADEESAGAKICQGILGKSGRWALVVERDALAACPR